MKSTTSTHALKAKPKSRPSRRGATDAKVGPADPWPPEPEAPDWLHWTKAGAIPLEDAVALSLGAEPTWHQWILNPPDSWPPFSRFEHSGRMFHVEHDGSGVSRTLHFHRGMTTDDGRRRLAIMREHFGTEAFPAAATEDGRPRVLLSDVARFAWLQGWQVPEPLGRLISTMGPQAQLAPTDPQRRTRVRAMLANECHAETILGEFVRRGIPVDLGYSNGHHGGIKQQMFKWLVESKPPVLQKSQFDRGWTALRARLDGKPKL